MLQTFVVSYSSKCGASLCERGLSLGPEPMYLYRSSKGRDNILEGLSPLFLKHKSLNNISVTQHLYKRVAIGNSIHWVHEYSRETRKHQP